MDPATIAATTVTALSPYLVAAAKKAAEKAGEATYEGGAKLLEFLKRKFTGESERKALGRIERDPEDPDNQAVLRVALKESLEQNEAFRNELEALLKTLPKAATTQSANVVGDGNVVNQAAGENISISVGDRK